MIDNLILELERFEREDWRYISADDHYFVEYLNYSQDQLLYICENDLFKYINLELLLNNIYIYALEFENYQIAHSRIDKLLDLVTEHNFRSLEFKILTQKLLMFHYRHRREEVEEIADYLYDTYYDMGCDEIRAKINKYISLGAESSSEKVEYQLKALQFYQHQDSSEKGFIYKNLAFKNLEIGEVEKSLYYLRKYLKLSPIMDQPRSYTTVVVSGYLEMVQEMGIVPPQKYEKLREELVARILI